jgi:Flp pilus assembly protein TadD
MSGGPYERAQLFAQLQRYDDAARDLTEHLSENPDDASAQAYFAYVLHRLGRDEEALETARRAVGLAPDSAYVHRILSMILRWQGQHQEGLESAREAIRLDPEDPECAALEAWCLAGLNCWPEVVEASERALARNPTHHWSLKLRACALLNLRQVDAARDAYSAALTVAPEDPDLHTDYASTLLRSRKHHDAVGHYREALRLDPTSERARAGLLEAIKETRPLFSPVLWWIRTSFRLASRRGLLSAFGLMVGTSLLLNSLPKIEAMKFLPGAVGLLYLLAIWTTWVGTPILDFLVWLRRDTRELLSQSDRRAAICVASLVCAAPIFAILVSFAGNATAAGLAPFAYLTAAMPVAAYFQMQSSRGRYLAAFFVFTCLAALAYGTFLAIYHGLTGEAIHPRTGKSKETPGHVLLLLSIVGSVLSTYLINNHFPEEGD